MTRSAQEFVGGITFEALTGRPVHVELIEAGHALDHIRLARAAQLVLVAPATADFLARAATGRADDLLSAILLATGAPVLLVPAMNDRMWAHPQTALNVQHLRAIGTQVLDPDVGELAVGEGSGPGRMPEPETILAHAGRLLEAHGPLGGKRIVVSAGPTREALDPVRFLSNRSSGRMGVAVAASAWRRGADVTLIHGPLSVPLPVGVATVRVETTEQMREAVAAALPKADVLIMAAAPADFRPASVAEEKIKKTSGGAEPVVMESTSDILLDTRPARRPGLIAVGFALETNDLLDNAREKLKRKALDLVVLNSAREPGAGFESETNRVTLVAQSGGTTELPLMSKDDVADALLDRVEELIRGR